MERDPIRWDSLLSIRSPLYGGRPPRVFPYYYITDLSGLHPETPSGGRFVCALRPFRLRFSLSLLYPIRESPCEDIETPRPSLLDGAYSISFRFSIIRP